MKLVSVLPVFKLLPFNLLPHNALLIIVLVSSYIVQYFGLCNKCPWIDAGFLDLLGQARNVGN